MGGRLADAVAVIACAGVCSGAAAEARSASVRSPCNPDGSRAVIERGERQDLVAARGRSRVFVVRAPGSFRDERVVFGCHGRSRRGPVSLDALSGRSVFAAPKKGALGMYGLQLTGSYAAWGSVGNSRPGDRGTQLGPLVRVVNLRTGRRRELPGAVDFEVTAHGVVYYILNVRIRDTFQGELGDGSDPGPGPFEVHRVRGRSDTVLDAGDGIDPRSLASNEGYVYWTHGAEARSFKIDAG